MLILEDSYKSLIIVAQKLLTGSVKMSKNIKTHEADLKLVQKFLDYANCADASYAMLHCKEFKWIWS